jgi:ribosomal protein S18 acetylase RimI-like enzyme
MLALAAEPARHLTHIVDLPYRLSSWALDDAANTQLWFEADRLTAWAVLQTPFWTVDLAVSERAAAGQLAAVLAWADERARAARGTAYGHDAWFVEADAGDTALQAALVEAGFVPQPLTGDAGWSKVLLRRPGALPVPAAPLPAGFSLRPLAGAAEVDAYVALHQTTFESRNMTAAWRARTLHHPGYDGTLDWVAVAPDGRLAAFCVGWFAAAGLGLPTGQIEPMGVHPDFQRRGLGRAVLSAVLRQLAARGAAQVLVETDGDRDAAYGLYTTLGFEPQARFVMYRKDYGPT